MSSAPNRTDVPTIEADTRPFWDAARHGRFLLRRCGDCDAIHHYPRPFCPECWSAEVTWFEASGDAELYTWSTVYVNDLAPFRDRLPYVAAVVTLAEGPKVMTNLIDCDGVELSIGMALEVAFQPLTDDLMVPVFVPRARPC